MHERALLELRRDPLFPRLSPTQQQAYLAGALAIGQAQGEIYHGRSVQALVEELGARFIIHEGGGNIAGSEVFAEYDSGEALITVYRSGIESIACQLAATIPQADAEGLALDLLIAHELFHHLEATRITPAPLQLPPICLPMLGGLWQVQRRVRSASEIAAYAFAHTVTGTMPLCPKDTWPQARVPACG